MDSYGLRAVWIVGHVWLVVRLPEGHELDLAASTQMLSASRFLLERVLDEMESSPNAAHRPEMVTLPDWGAPTGAARPAGAERLRGAYLILADRDAEDRIGFRALDMFSRLGVSGITYLPKFRNDTATEIRFNLMPRWRRLVSLAVLFARRKAAVANRRLAGPLKPVPFHPGEDGRCETPAIQALDASLDDTGEPEQYERFMLFEGGRQLVPVRNTHDRIARDRDGRYSLWDRKLTFAPTEPGRLFRSLYWLVENDAANRTLLPYYPVRDRARGAAGSAKLAALLDAHAAPTNRPLRKGDTVVVATHALPPGGAERQWAYLAVGLKRAGYDVKVVVYRKLVGVDAHFAHLLEDEGIPVLDPDSVLQKPFSLFDIDDLLLWAIFKADVVDDLPKLWRFVEMMKRLDPKAVYVQLDEPNIYLSLAALVADVPHVVPSFRNTNPSTFAYHQPWFRSAYQVVARSRRVTMSGNSRLANEDYAGWLGLDPSQDRLHPERPRPRSSSRGRPRPRRRRCAANLGLRAGDRVVLGVFRLAEEKNPLCFLQDGRAPRPRGPVHAGLRGRGGPARRSPSPARSRRGGLSGTDHRPGPAQRRQRADVPVRPPPPHVGSRGSAQRRARSAAERPAGGGDRRRRHVGGAQARRIRRALPIGRRRRARRGLRRHPDRWGAGPAHGGGRHGLRPRAVRTRRHGGALPRAGRRQADAGPARRGCGTRRRGVTRARALQPPGQTRW